MRHRVKQYSAWIHNTTLDSHCSYKVSLLIRDKINFRCINFISFSFFFLREYSRIFLSSKDFSNSNGNNFYNIEALIFLRCRPPKATVTRKDNWSKYEKQESKDKGLDNWLYTFLFRRVKFLHSTVFPKYSIFHVIWEISDRKQARYNIYKMWQFPFCLKISFKEKDIKKKIF